MIPGIMLFCFGCEREGCTDSIAANYDENARTNDGSCEYKGCTDPDAVNHLSYATIENGTCLYTGAIRMTMKDTRLDDPFIAAHVNVNGEFRGTINASCEAEFPDCSSSCDGLLVQGIVEGNHTYQIFLVRATGTLTFDTLQVGIISGVQVTPKICQAVKISLI